MKIVFNLGSMTKGGAERVVANLSDYFVKEDNQVSIITSITGKSYYELNEKVSLYNLDDDKPINNIIIKNINRTNKLKDLIKNIKPDIVISLLPEPSYRILFLKIFNRKLKVIVSVRNDPKIEYKSRMNRIIMKILYPLADGFIFQTEEARRYFNKKIQDKSIVIPNSIDEQFIVEPYEGEREKIIVSVGRLEKQKNQKILIDAFSKLPQKFNEYKLIIYGEGSLRSELTKQINELKLQERVYLPGEVDDIKEKIYKATIFVLSSDYEGMPNALIEAMALGIPCISTDCPCGGPKFLIENNVSGFLVEKGNQEKMTEIIQHVLNIDKTQISNIIRKAQNKIYDIRPSRINKEWFDFINYIRGIR